ncbi:uncharacterized protein J8A68_005447 [[Candida] subhashii]|uniref:Zn(2)-C6 fungal-type domain-containing protein n=1 Tax=[Candida] subhashii TaxID=561895 RepID=A0A8J5QM89_9ASCO|nr:uncharacterized protein J8A68_005447 [[Candida] subhashii]KAG7661075.1 hypothetical protein J8A68_005447 [[Candida] subhashii]
MTETKKPKQTRVRKHVSKACLECRKRHFKCDGATPTCDRCLKGNKICTYVASHRGGSRKKGVSNKNKLVTVNDVNQGPKMPMFLAEIEDFPMRNASTTSIEDAPTMRERVDNIKNNNDMVKEIFKLPCAMDHSRCDGSNCPGKTAVNYFEHRKDGPLNENESQMVEGLRKRVKLDYSIGNLDCLFAGRDAIKDVRSFQQLEINLRVSNFDHFMDPSSYDKDEILKNYFDKFHRAHPLMPPREELLVYLANPSIEKEVLTILKIVGDGQITNMYAKGKDLISDRLIQCVNIVRQNPSVDLVSIQVLFLVALIAHISSFHAFSKKLRHFCIHLISELQINLIDNEEKEVVNVDALTPSSNDGSSGATLAVFDSPRLSHIPRSSIADSARRLFWELYFFDVIIGSADGKTVSKLDSLDRHLSYPIYPPREQFDYKGRAEAAKLVSDAVKMNIEIINKRPFESISNRLKASLSSWEMKLEDPKLFGAPPLIHKNGKVNEGVHQSILLYNYAKIFVHRPFSYLWKINAPQHPQCSEEVLEAKEMPTQMKADSRTNIETKKTIEAANSIVEVLIDTNSSKILDRTPLFACGLALASLVHLSAYIWVETTIQNDRSQNFGLSKDDLDIYTEYIKLSLTAIYPISNHWELSGKLAKHIRESLTALRPNLYSKLKDFLPRIEIGLENMSLSENPSDNTAINSVDHDLSSNTSPSVHYDLSYVTQNNSQQQNKPSYLNETNLNALNESRGNTFNLRFDSTTPNNQLVSNNDQLDFGGMSGQLSPVSDTGCDWIDKALLDFFEEAVPGL